MATGASERPLQAPPEQVPAVTAAPAEASTAADQDQSRPRSRLIGSGEIVSASAAFVLLVAMFGAEWYGVAGVPDPSAARPAAPVAIDAWNALPIVRWVMLATIAAALGSLALHFSQRSHGSRTDTSRLVTALGSLTSVLLAYRVLIALPSSERVIDQKLGAVLGLGCALAIALGGWQSMLEQKAAAPRPVSRSRRRRRAAGEAPDG
jgi:hypothetical protein